ncbi:MAG: hypothetical protein AAGA22_02415 [Pseudomonadota bacterium]
MTQEVILLSGAITIVVTIISVSLTNMWQKRLEKFKGDQSYNFFLIKEFQSAINRVCDSVKYDKNQDKSDNSALIDYLTTMTSIISNEWDRMEAFRTSKRNSQVVMYYKVKWLGRLAEMKLMAEDKSHISYFQDLEKIFQNNAEFTKYRLSVMKSFVYEISVLIGSPSSRLDIPTEMAELMSARKSEPGRQ